MLYVLGAAMGTIGQGRAGGAVAACALAVVVHQSIRNMTDLSRGECLLIATWVTGFGWLASRITASCYRIPTPSDGQSSASSRWLQWSIWDMCLITAWSICTFSAATRFANGGAPVHEVVLVFLAGIMASWVAMYWIACDCWTAERLLLVATLLVGLGGMVVLATPQGNLLQKLAWITAGPLATAWGQATTVVALTGCARVDATQNSKASAAKRFSVSAISASSAASSLAK